MKVIVDFRKLPPKGTDRGLIGWLHRIPSDKKYKDVRYEDVGKRNGLESKIEEVLYGRGFYISNESDPLFLEFRKKFPHTEFRIEE